MGERSWWDFYNLIQELPRHGKFHAAMAMDEDFAQQLKARMDEERPDDWDWFDDEPDVAEMSYKERSPEGFSPEMALGYAIDEHLQSLIRITLAAHGDGKSKPPEIQKWPRPFTRYDTLLLHEEKNTIDEIRAEFNIGGGYR